MTSWRRWVLRFSGSEFRDRGQNLPCVYIAPDVESVREHARKSGLPANSVAKVESVIDPTTAED